MVTEYAWNADSCDPCPVPALTLPELTTLGADVLPSYEQLLKGRLVPVDLGRRERDDLRHPRLGRCRAGCGAPRLLDRVRGQATRGGRRPAALGLAHVAERPGYSDLVALELWRYTNPAEAAASVVAIEADSPGVRSDYEIHLKGLHEFWLDGEYVYFYYLRGIAFVDECLALEQALLEVAPAVRRVVAAGECHSPR